ncbi:MAG TPA: hypothetical protein IGS17_18385 [Oscillatoriales cyanobacterium M59_W2019_021]|nr:hypothetical protein [Oscillatoriales cyanobacterium M4454_W2019_049]HIK52870.1 hypothetical protein [Oscillatoriales cyanobacterium M59_W2019_021]
MPPILPLPLPYSPSTYPSACRLVEAQGWYVDAQGGVILTANAPTVTPQGIVWGRSSCDLPSSSDRS